MMSSVWRHVCLFLCFLSLAGGAVHNVSFDMGAVGGNNGTARSSVAAAAVWRVAQNTSSDDGPYYGDPNGVGGCRDDEIEVHINGIDGDACVPQCLSDGGCPERKPEGVEAEPSCVLHDLDGNK